MTPKELKESDDTWERAGRDNRWRLPPKKNPLLRLPGVRHVRWFGTVCLVTAHYALGPGRIGIPTGYDEWVLYAVRRGWC